MAGNKLQQFLRGGGDAVNQYLGGVSTATAPGAGGDLMSYITNELTKYPGTRDAEASAPMFDVINNVITNLLGATGLNDPLSSASGPAQAILGPVGRVTSSAVGSPGAAKAVNQAQKKIIKALFKGDPETLKEVLASPNMLHVGVPGAGSGMPKKETQELLDSVMQGAFAHFQPGNLGGTMRVHPSVMRGQRPVTGEVLKKQGVEGLPDMAVHEATHFLNDPNFTKMIVRGANRPQFNLAAALRPLIHHTKYGPDIVGQHLARGATPTAVDEALSYLAQPSGRTPAATWLNNALTSRPRSGDITQFDDYTRSLLQEALGAALEVPGVRR